MLYVDFNPYKGKAFPINSQTNITLLPRIFTSHKARMTRNPDSQFGVLDNDSWFGILLCGLSDFLSFSRPFSKIKLALKHRLNSSDIFIEFLTI